jgi:hypothetical protein
MLNQLTFKLALLAAFIQEEVDLIAPFKNLLNIINNNNGALQDLIKNNNNNLNLKNP